MLPPQVPFKLFPAKTIQRPTQLPSKDISHENVLPLLKGTPKITNILDIIQVVHLRSIKSSNNDYTLLLTLSKIKNKRQKS